MKILPFKIPKASNESIRLQADDDKVFYDHLHQHPETQLTVILSGEGKIIAGDYLGNFKPGDVFLIGPNLPHVFRSDKKYYQEESVQRAQSLSVFFEWRSFGDNFLSLPELKSLQEFSKLSERGLSIKSTTSTHVRRLMKQLFLKNDMDRIIVLLKILHLLALSPEKEVLASAGVYSNYDEQDGKRLADIYRFTMKEYHRKIQLEEVASIANMTTNSFCRYFKKRTRKSYIDFLNEIRIGQSKKLLQQGDLSISQISYEVGFTNLSNFNRKFKEVCSVTPTEFKKVQVN